MNDKVENLRPSGAAVPEKKSVSNNGKASVYESLEQAIRRPSVMAKTSSVI